MLLEPKPLTSSQRSELGDGEDPYRAIFERYPHPAWVLDRATLRILAVNDAALAEFGYAREVFLAMPYLDLLTAQDSVAARLKLGQAAPPRGSARWRVKTKGGSLVAVEAVWRPVPFDRVPAILLTAESTQPGLRRLLQEAEEGRIRLEALSRRLVEIQESERSEIARQIHDEIGQLLTGLKLMLATGPGTAAGEIGSGEPGPPSARQGEMLGIVNELIGRLRDLSMDLRPPMLDEIGLVAALSWHFERYTARTHVRVSFQHSIRDARFPASVEIAAFRIIQEALTNVALHACAETVEVEIGEDVKFLKVRIEDSGLGFDRGRATAGGSAGLTGMRERALLIGGNFSIESAPRAGTRVSVELPLRTAADAWN
ncbi:MAG TPA: PAS domain-containing sensor histidine kinase [Candidatus Eisenbacteria bacterium]|nr:PAS domain-containing sensor histidine kinase [Candidatus Eisenbacteria bacterium]